MNTQNPIFRKPSESTQTPPTQNDNTWIGEQANALLFELSKIQREMNALLSEHLRALDDQSVYAVAMVLIISFAYGVIHAIGPGHGKTVVGLYCISNREKPKKAFQLGFMIAAIHAVSALCLTFTLYFVLKMMLARTFNEVASLMQLVSGVTIILIGCYLLYGQIRAQHTHSDEKESFFRNSEKGPFFIALSVGIVPCPGVMTILLFSIALKHYLVGIASAVAMSVGMGLTISVLGWLAVKTKEKAGERFSSLDTVLGYVGAAMIILLGVVLVLIR